MSEAIIITLILVLSRLSIVLIGFGFAFLGYRLFRTGVEKATELKAAWGDKNLVLKQAAPGTLFAVFGVVVVFLSVYREINVEKIPVTKQAASPAKAATPAEVDTPTEVVDAAIRAQALMTLSSPSAVDNRLKQVYANLVDKLLADGAADDKIIDDLFLATLARFPDEQEKKADLLRFIRTV